MLDSLKYSIRAKVIRNMIALLAVFVASIVGSLIFFETKQTLFLTGIVLSLVSFFMFFLYLRKLNLNNNYLIQLIEHEPQRVVWVYSIITQRMPFGIQIAQSGLLYFKLIDGDEIVLSMSEKKLKQIAQEIQPLLPHATFGYTKDREQWYMADPALLYK